MIDLQDFLSVTPYDVLVICFELLYIILLLSFIIKNSVSLFDIDLEKLKVQEHRLYSYALLCILIASLIIISGIISHESQESLLNEFINLLLYSALALITLLIKRVICSAGRYNMQINYQIYQNNSAALIYHISQLFSTALLSSFIIRSFYGESMLHILLIIMAGEFFIMLIMYVINLIFLRCYGVIPEHIVIKKDWHIATQIASFRLLVTMSLCAGTTLIFIAQNNIFFSIALWIIVSAITMIAIMLFVYIMNKLFLQQNYNMHLLSPEQTGAYCILHFLMYATVGLFIIYILT